VHFLIIKFIKKGDYWKQVMTLL